jgi:hypothetical protein
MGVSKRTKTYASRYKTDVSVSQTTNTGFDSTTRRLCSGDGADSSMAASDDVFTVQPVNDDTTGAMLVQTSGGSNILAVDTSNSIVKAGAGQVNVLTLYKEMGLYDFTPAIGYHYPLVANTMHFETAFVADNDWGNADDPRTTCDVSELTAQENAIAVYWYLQDDITLDSIRAISTADASDGLKFHLLSYDLDVSSNHGDLSGGVVHAAGIGLPTATTIKTNTLTISTEDVDQNKVVIGFVESDSTTDLSVAFNIKYHIR